MQYIIHIPDEHERYKFAAKIKKILTNAKMNPEEYIANVSQKVLAQVLRQIESRGYTVINAKGSENPSLQHSGSSPQQSQKTIGEITHGII